MELETVPGCFVVVVDALHQLQNLKQSSGCKLLLNLKFLRATKDVTLLSSWDYTLLLTATCHPLPAAQNLRVAAVVVPKAEFKTEFLISFHLINFKTKSCCNKPEWNPELGPFSDTVTCGKNIARKIDSLGK